MNQTRKSHREGTIEEIRNAKFEIRNSAEGGTLRLCSENERFSLTGRIRSFRHAVHGIVLMLKSQHNAWVHATASIIVLLIGAFFSLSPHEWCWLVIAIMAVWTAEALNTALEFLANVASAEFHPLVAKAKDVAAGAVLISAIGSVAIALLILGPYAVGFLNSIL